jgi:hypothetical protein
MLDFAIIRIGTGLFKTQLFKTKFHAFFKLYAANFSVTNQDQDKTKMFITKMQTRLKPKNQVRQNKNFQYKRGGLKNGLETHTPYRQPCTFDGIIFSRAATFVFVFYKIIVFNATSS